MSKDSTHGLNKIIAINMLIVISLVTLFTYMQYCDYQETEIKYNENEIVLDQQIDTLITSILKENQKKAELYAGAYADEIRNRLLEEYRDDMTQLAYDIKNPTHNSRLTTILDETLTDIYINNNTNSNKPIVTSADIILWNKSIGYVTSNKESSISLDDFAKMHYNEYLAQKSIDQIKLENIDKYDFIFWEKDPSSIPGHQKIKDMDINKVLEVYKKEGISTLKSYDILVPIYIDKNGDIFKDSETNIFENQNDEYKIIIIQRINMYDAVKDYLPKIQKLEDKIHEANSDIIMITEHKVELVIKSIALLLVLLLVSSLLQNKIYYNKNAN